MKRKTIINKYKNATIPMKDSRVSDLEKRIADLEELVDRIMRSNVFAFQDFKFIKENDHE